MNRNDIILIEKYIANELESDELLSFERRLTTDKVLAEELRRSKKLRELWVEAEEYQSTKSEIEALIKEEKSKRFLRNNIYIFSVAASIIVLISFYFLLFYEYSTDKQGQEYRLAKNIDSVSNKEKPIVFQLDEAEKFAKTDTVKGKTRLISPLGGEIVKNSEPIVFQWKSDFSRVDTLFIADAVNKTTIQKLKIKLTDTVYTIKYPQFTKGSYLWYISDSTNFETFVVK